MLLRPGAATFRPVPQGMFSNHPAISEPLKAVGVKKDSLDSPCASASACSTHWAADYCIDMLKRIRCRCRAVIRGGVENAAWRARSAAPVRPPRAQARLPRSPSAPQRSHPISAQPVSGPCGRNCSAYRKRLFMEAQSFLIKYAEIGTSG